MEEARSEGMIRRMLSDYQLGDPQSVVLRFVEALESAVNEKDERSKAYLLRCAVLVFPPAKALPWVSNALSLAKTHQIHEEEAPTLANLGLVHLELGALEEAQAHLEESLMHLEGGARAVALNNLALAVASTDRERAFDLLAEAVGLTEDRHLAAMVCNLLVLEAEETRGCPDLTHEVLFAAENCAAPLFDLVLFNHVRSLLEAGNAAQALQEVKAYRSKAREFRDGSLAMARWACLHGEILTALGRRIPRKLAEQAAVLDHSAEAEVWLYRTRWALCPIPLDQSAKTVLAEGVDLEEIWDMLASFKRHWQEEAREIRELLTMVCPSVSSSRWGLQWLVAEALSCELREGFWFRRGGVDPNG